MQFQQNTFNNLIWIDLEMTGINPDKDHILEIAIAITDHKLNIINDNFDIVIHQPRENLAIMNEFVTKLHTNNGLLKMVADSFINIETAENLAVDYISNYVKLNTSPMCGNSICMDRRFLFKYMPRLENYFHYRNLDVSTIKNLGIYWFPEIVKNFKKPDSAHRAKEDIINSINELKFYLDNLFIKN